jgi:hypothetical protein
VVEGRALVTIVLLVAVWAVLWTRKGLALLNRWLPAVWATLTLATVGWVTVAVMFYLTWLLFTQ